MKIKFKDTKFFYLLQLAAVLFICIVFPLFASAYNIHLAILCFVWSVIAMNWNLLLGHAGIPSFGNLVFYAVGGYSSAWLAINMGVSPWVGILVGGLLALILGISIAFLTFRLRGVYVALFTFAFQEMLRYIVLLPEATKWTGGPIGLMRVPRFTLANFRSIYLDYYLGFVILLINILVVYKMLNSRIGLAIKAMAQSETYAKTLGVNTFKYKLIIFIIAAFFTGIAGSFSAHYLRAVSDEYLSFMLMVSIIFMILIGGLGTFYGPIFGAFAYTIFSEYLKGVLPGEIRLLVISVAIIAIVILFPRGILEAMHNLFRFASKSKTSKISA
ncbi:branched-chain amino acid ABC transporter permease [Candidatus Bathyarchaeota archaeon]|nr:branched-chain amino acid ABC transporter permease [Candidatus Bathyarchaeota archaeon]